jgi:hypothetical protein
MIFTKTKIQCQAQFQNIECSVVKISAIAPNRVISPTVNKHPKYPKAPISSPFQFHNQHQPKQLLSENR